jgi:plastocyanin
MKLLIALLAAFFIALPASAADVVMGAGFELVFEPSELTVPAGEVITFTNEGLPPHNVIIEDHPEFSHDGLAFAPGESFTITIDQAGDYNFWCDPHKGAGMTGIIHVN